MQEYQYDSLSAQLLWSLETRKPQKIIDYDCSLSILFVRKLIIKFLLHKTIYYSIVLQNQFFNNYMIVIVDVNSWFSMQFDTKVEFNNHVDRTELKGLLVPSRKNIEH